MIHEDSSRMTDPVASAFPDPATTQFTRRSLLTTTGVVGAALASGLAFSADAPGHKHADRSPRYLDAFNAANNCSGKARLCLVHCLMSFEGGDTTLASCASSINQMISLCDTFSSQVANISKYIDGIAEVCRAACADCEKECRKHEKQHAECRECADACADLVSAIDNL